jgi:hypothetical protein
VKGVLSALIGSLLGLIPFASGLVVFMTRCGANHRRTVQFVWPHWNPCLRRHSSKVSRFSDAGRCLNKFNEVPIGAVYLRRTGNQVEALNVVCPHAGCPLISRRRAAVFTAPAITAVLLLRARSLIPPVLRLVDGYTRCGGS